jgi:hypothetical protein
VRVARKRVLVQQASLAGTLVQADPAGQLPHVMAEVHDKARNQDGPEAESQRDLIVRGLVQQVCHGNVSERDREANVLTVIFGYFADCLKRRLP